MLKVREGCLWSIGVLGGGFLAFYFGVLDRIMVVSGVILLGTLFKKAPIATVVFLVSTFVAVKIPALNFVFKPIALIAIAIIFIPILRVLFGGDQRILHDQFVIGTRSLLHLQSDSAEVAVSACVSVPSPHRRRRPDQPAGLGVDRFHHRDDTVLSVPELHGCA